MGVTTVYTVNEAKDSVTSAPKTSSSLLFRWFNNNSGKANSNKSYFIMSCKESNKAMIDGLSIESSKTEVLLDITIDQELKFDEHVNYLCKNAGQKLNAFACITPFMNINKKKNILKAFTESQFGCCPLIWMFRGRRVNNKEL